MASRGPKIRVADKSRSPRCLLEDVIDFEAERARLDKRIKKLQNTAYGQERKLSNEKFVAVLDEQLYFEAFSSVTQPKRK